MKQPICHESRDLGFERKRRERNQWWLTLILATVLGVLSFSLKLLIDSRGGFTAATKSLFE